MRGIETFQFGTYKKGCWILGIPSWPPYGLGSLWPAAEAPGACEYMPVTRVVNNPMTAPQLTSRDTSSEVACQAAGSDAHAGAMSYNHYQYHFEVASRRHLAVSGTGMILATEHCWSPCSTFLKAGGGLGKNPQSSHEQPRM